MKKEQLEKLHTRQLLVLLKQSRRCCEWQCGSPNCIDNQHEHSVEEIKEILKTRPHVMNKKESYEYRKARAQGKI